MRSAILVLAMLRLRACDVPAAPDGGLPDASTTLDVATNDAAPIPAACRADAPVPASARRTVEANGLTRSYILHVPSGYDRAATPVVFAFHGWNANAADLQSRTHLDATADRGRFLAVYPQGVDDSFNAGGTCCGGALRRDLDEAAFARAILADLGDELCLDRRRVYATGISNGGFLSYRFACEHADLFAAVAPVAAIVSVPTCAPSRPVPVLHFHGTADLLVPVAGRPSWSPPVPSLDETIQGWRQRNGCTGASRVTYQSSDVTCEAWTTCRDGAEVERCLVDGGGHTWPGGEPVPLLGRTTRDLDASEYLWRFFARHAPP